MPISVNSGEYKSPVGFADLYVALVSQDNAAGYAAGTPEYFAPAAEASVEPATGQNTQYMDDIPYDVQTSEGETQITLTVSNIPAEMYALITGNIFDATTGRVYDVGGTPPDMALMFRAMKSNGTYRYYSFLKGKFSVPSDAYASKSDTPDPKPIQIVFTAVRTIYKFSYSGSYYPTKRVWGDANTTNFSATTWFNQVQTPASVAPAALSLSSSTPADGATGVSVSANLSLTFNNALNAAATYGITLVKSTGGVVQASAITIDSTRKIITIDPNVSLTAASQHILTYAVTDIYGQSLQGAVDFTTA